MKNLYAGVILSSLVLITNGCESKSESEDEPLDETSGYNLSYIADDVERTSIESSGSYTSILVDNTFYIERKTEQNKNRKYSSAQAKNYCSTLNYSNGGWRLPTENELNIAINIGKELNFEESDYTFYQTEDGIIESSYKCESTTSSESLGCAFSSAPTENFVICTRDMGATDETILKNLTESDKMVVKISNIGEEIADNSSEYSALLYKDPSLNIMLALERTEAGFTQTKTYAEATEYCEELNYIGYENWRLPSLEETDVMSSYYNDNSDELLVLAKKSYHWSSDTYHRNSTTYAYVFKINGISHDNYSISGRHEFICIRSND